MRKQSKAVLFFNPRADQVKDGHTLSIIHSHFIKHSIDLKIFYVPKPKEELHRIVNECINDGYELFIAAGGDGTVSLVSDPLVNTGKLLGILPTGTGNLIAKTLRIPIKLEKSLELITSNAQKTRRMDAIKVLNDRNYISNVSAGVSPELMSDTHQEDKQKIGFFAYIIKLGQKLLGLQQHRYYLEYDQKIATFLATEILITNGSKTGLTHVEWPEEIQIDDGLLDIIVLQARNIFDFLGLAFSLFSKTSERNPKFKKITFSQYCRIESRSPQFIQADGDVISKTPVEIQVLPQAVNFIVKS
jgi:YegS/Rv2252/BmrU family lipid kinase